MNYCVLVTNYIHGNDADLQVIPDKVNVVFLFK